MLNLFINKSTSRQAPVPPNIFYFAELGQSNSEGRDGDELNPDYPFNSLNGAKSFDGTNLITLNTLRGDAVSGSYANYFADRLYSLSTDVSYMIESGSGASGLTATSSGGAEGNDWSATGDLRGLAEIKIDAALALHPHIPFRAMLWCQGENDALKMDTDPGTYLITEVKAAMQDVVDWWQLKYPGIPFVISQTGRQNNIDTVGYQNMRLVQTEIVNENTGVYMGFDGAVDFAQGGMSDNVHYDYGSYQIMGESLADYINTNL